VRTIRREPRPGVGTGRTHWCRARLTNREVE
jgi:hypothetical protein